MSQELNILKELHSEFELVKKALSHLQHSYNSCLAIGLQENYTDAELEKWEAFTARYARLSDIITQKVMNTILLVETGSTGSLLDKANFTEKLGWVIKAEDFRQLRFLRNYIAHEYLKQNTNEIFELVLDNYSKLVLFINHIIN
ncbi:MAG: hypothetical protein H7068_03105, partial [Pedobacter sp.]|nr:hypothetical protein [Chitinophagaceae bacterium]